MAKNAYSIPKIIIRNCKEYFKKARGWGLLEQGVAVLRALFWTAGIVATNNLFDALTSASNPTFNGLASKTLILGAVLITQQILSGSGQYLLSKVSYSNMGKFMVDFQKKLGRVPAVKFEESDFLNSVNKAKECLEYESLGHFASTCLQLFTYYSVYILSVGGYLFYVSPILPVIILIAFVPSVIGQLTHVKVLVELEKNNAPLRRENEYYKKTIVGKSYFMETRMLGGFSYLRNLFMLSLIQITDKTWKTERKMALVQLMLSLTTFIGLGVSILLLLNLTMTGAIGVGAFVSVFIALSQIFSIMEEVVAAVVGNGIATIVQVTNFYRLMDMTEVTGTETKPDFDLGIAASNIKFAYPGTEHFALRDVSLSIKPGETIAIVGENGSGKSTLVRHLIGLYTPQSGSVKIGGVDSSDTLPKSLYGQTSAVFQKFQRYKMTLSENITMSDIDKPVNDARIHAVIKDAEFNETKARLDTMLSPEFGGIDLSGGQWQRLAIARGLYRPNEFIVLDEPSASIDPLEETRLFKHFKAIAKDKCALIVTHRLGSVKLADRIVVMDGGSIAEIGTHDALLENKGKYAEMWHKQMHWYVDDI